MEIPAKDIDILPLINTSYLYGLINDGINKYNDSNTTQGFINNMVDNTNTTTVVENNNKMTTNSKLKKVEPVVVHENNHGAMKLAEIGMKSNNTLGAHIVEEKKGGFTDGLTNMTCGRITPIHLQMRINRVAHTRSRKTTAFLNSSIPKTTGSQKQEL